MCAIQTTPARPRAGTERPLPRRARADSRWQETAGSVEFHPAKDPSDYGGNVHGKRLICVGPLESEESAARSAHIAETTFTYDAAEPSIPNANEWYLVEQGRVEERRYRRDKASAVFSDSDPLFGPPPRRRADEWYRALDGRYYLSFSPEETVRRFLLEPFPEYVWCLEVGVKMASLPQDARVEALNRRRQRTAELQEWLDDLQRRADDLPLTNCYTALRSRNISRPIDPELPGNNSLGRGKIVPFPGIEAAKRWLRRAGVSYCSVKLGDTWITYNATEDSRDRQRQRTDLIQAFADKRATKAYMDTDPYAPKPHIQRISETLPTRWHIERPAFWQFNKREDDFAVQARIWGDWLLNNTKREKKHGPTTLAKAEGVTLPSERVEESTIARWTGPTNGSNGSEVPERVNREARRHKVSYIAPDPFWWTDVAGLTMRYKHWGKDRAARWQSIREYGGSAVTLRFIGDSFAFAYAGPALCLTGGTVYREGVLFKDVVLPVLDEECWTCAPCSAAMMLAQRYAAMRSSFEGEIPVIEFRDYWRARSTSRKPLADISYRFTEAVIATIREITRSAIMQATNDSSYRSLCFNNQKRIGELQSAERAKEAAKIINRTMSFCDARYVSLPLQVANEWIGKGVPSYVDRSDLLDTAYESYTEVLAKTPGSAAWELRVAIYRDILDYLKKERERRRIVVVRDPSELKDRERLAPATHLPSHVWEMRMLKPKERQAITLVYIDELTQTEAAEKMNKGQQYISRLCRSGLKKLRAALLESASARAV